MKRIALIFAAAALLTAFAGESSAAAAARQPSAEGTGAAGEAKASDSAKPAQELVDGAIYAHTLRRPKPLKNVFYFWRIKADAFPAKESAPAEGFSIRLGAGESATFALSNNMAIYAAQDTQFKVDSFKMGANDLANKFSNASRLELSLPRGTLYFYAPDLTAMTPYYVRTPTGTFEIRSSQAEVSAGDGTAYIAVLDGYANFTPNGSGSGEFISRGNSFLAVGQAGKSAPKISIANLEISKADAMRPRLEMAKTANRTVGFSMSKDGKIAAERIVSPDFLEDRKN
ncbi:MAG: hypothetical protein DBX55_05700 [Verrucomicrobia bacterium]|nr:MAG: hypothetical protein DBX55_05700 [Verrucomicrobiota bacterium]